MRSATSPADVRAGIDVVCSPAVGWPRTAELERELARNAESWAALRRLGVRPGSALPLHFCFESGGQLADRRLADFLRLEHGYDAEVDEDGVTGCTPALALDLELLDRWTQTMLAAAHAHEGCRFAGWTVTVSRGGRW